MKNRIQKTSLTIKFKQAKICYLIGMVKVRARVVKTKNKTNGNQNNGNESYKEQVLRSSKKKVINNEFLSNAAYFSFTCIVY